jgi:hypothetical protein
MSELTGTYEDEIEASLKPCPRCNGKALIENFDEILCDSCGLWSGDDWPSLDEAVEWWNKQPHIEALKARIAELEAQLAATWQPVESGYKHESIYTVDDGKRWWLAISGEGRELPPDLRLCRKGE